MKYLVRKEGDAKSRAHIWTGDDTLCRMWSTGGLIKDRYEHLDFVGGRQLCQMCALAATARGGLDDEIFA